MHTETSKPHIARLPIVPYTPHPITNNKLAVSIPLFHSAIDSGTLTPHNAERFKNIHIKAAIWAAIALQNNTDLTQHGIGIYFHVEDKVLDFASEVFDQFNVPASAMRSMTVRGNSDSRTLNHPHYGKKLMCLDDPDITPDAWLIVDSDAFVCSAEKRLTWYDRLLSLDTPATVQASQYSTTSEEMWVYGVCLAAGLPFDANANLLMQEHRAAEQLGIDYKQDHGRPFIASQLTYIPTSHAICKFLKEHYINCYQDEFLMGMWHLKHNDIAHLAETLGLPLYYHVKDYMNRKKSYDADGYLLHLNDVTPAQVDLYYDDFFDGLGGQPPACGG